MKKLIAIFIAVLLMSFCLSFTVSAKEIDFVISEDFQSLTYDGVTYRRADLCMVSIEYSHVFNVEPQLSTQQQELLRDTDFYMDSSKTVIEATFSFRDGSTLSCGFVSEEFHQQLQDHLSNDETECYIEFYWDEYLRTTAQEADLKGSLVTLDSRTLQKADTFPVYVNSGIWEFSVIKGSLLVVNGDFYYVNHFEADFYEPYTINLYERDTLECYEITDPEVITEIEDALGAYYNAAFSSESILSIASIVFWGFIFVVIPAGILVLAVIFFIRGKGFYRYVWGATAICAVMELVIFAAVIVNLLLAA